VLKGLFGGDAHHGQVQVAADDGRDVTERHSLVGDAVQPGARGCGLDRKPVQARGVQGVDARPPVGPVADVSRDAFVAGDVDQAVGGPW
jgi:hypothetical protein